MRLAIHTDKDSFSGRWIEYCEANNIPYTVVDCFSSTIVSDLRGCSGLMWHWLHYDSGAALFARQLTLSLESTGMPVFPSSMTAWHYDDKLGQKYLLESHGLPLVPTTVFYDKGAALDWAKEADFPQVFKLRRGAGSMNVMLVRSRREAARAISRAFGRGWVDQTRTYVLDERLRHFRRDPSLLSAAKVGHGLLVAAFPRIAKKVQRTRELGYAYFQEFIPENDCDIRVVTIGDRAFAIKRMTRENDFRASGSGVIIHDPSQIPIECVQLAFDASAKLEAQCQAFDFVVSNGKFLIIEISYSFSSAGYLDCPGFWDGQLRWNEGKFTPEWFMVEDFVGQCANAAWRTVEGRQPDRIRGTSLCSIRSFRPPPTSPSSPACR